MASLPPCLCVSVVNSSLPSPHSFDPPSLKCYKEGLCTDLSDALLVFVGSQSNFSDAPEPRFRRPQFWSRTRLQRALGTPFSSPLHVLIPWRIPTCSPGSHPCKRRYAVRQSQENSPR